MNQEKKKKKNWKSNLLSSGLPLEYEAANILVSNHFVISADFTYQRKGINYSVDIKADTIIPPSVPPEGTGFLTLLVECKYRHPDTKWLFFGDPNEIKASDVIGMSIRTIDEYSQYLLNREEIIDFDANLSQCYKGTEILYDERIDDTEVKHGIEQLQYALPRLYTLLIFSWIQSSKYCPPIFFCPILLTTSELYIAKTGLTMEQLKDSEAITDFADKVPFFLYISNCGWDFEQYCKNEIFPLLNIQRKQIVEIASKRQDSIKAQKSLNPIEICNGLMHSNWLFFNLYFTKFLICNFNEFTNLIEKFRGMLSKTNQSKIQLFKWH